MNENELEALVQQIKLVAPYSANITSYKTQDGGDIFKIADKEKQECLVVIDSNVETTYLKTVTSKGMTMSAFTLWINDGFKYKIIKVIGGSPKLDSLYKLFKAARAKEIDINNLDITNVTHMIETFASAEIEKLSLDWWASRGMKDQIENMSYTFENANIGQLDLSLLQLESLTKATMCFDTAKIGMDSASKKVKKYIEKVEKQRRIKRR